MSDWQDKSDFDVNKAVSKRLGVSVDDGPYLAYQEVNKPSVPVSQGMFPNRWVDYCNNPADAWPIILENNIIIEPRKNNTSLAYIKCDAPNEDENPLRAAMIVYLEMNNA